MQELTKITYNAETKTGKLRAYQGYPPGADVLCKFKDTGNGYIFKFPSYSSIYRDNYICMDYDEAGYLAKVLQFLAKQEGWDSCNEGETNV